jgi:hypothetical protein
MARARVHSALWRVAFHAESRTPIVCFTTGMQIGRNPFHARRGPYDAILSLLVCGSDAKPVPRSCFLVVWEVEWVSADGAVQARKLLQEQEDATSVRVRWRKPGRRPC